MRICGFDLKLILAFQLELHVERTVLVTPDHTSAAGRPYPVSRNHAGQDSIRRYFFAKIGRGDAVVYPAILPGSIVRADCAYSPEIPNNGSATDDLWLVEHPAGLACCQIKRVDEKHIVLLPDRNPLPRWPLRLGTEARVLGLVDLELRPGDAPEPTPCRPPRFEHRPMQAASDRPMNFSTLVRASRSRAGLTLRAAHDMTMSVARLLGNRDYGIALGQLSDYEATDKLPRHVAKVMSLCIVYGLDPLDLLAAVGVRVDDSDKAPLSLPDARANLLPCAYPSGRYLCSPRYLEGDWLRGKYRYEAGRASRD
jgi:hypothetical protein